VALRWNQNAEDDGRDGCDAYDDDLLQWLQRWTNTDYVLHTGTGNEIF